MTLSAYRRSLVDRDSSRSGLASLHATSVPIKRELEIQNCMFLVRVLDSIL